MLSGPIVLSVELRRGVEEIFAGADSHQWIELLVVTSCLCCVVCTQWKILSLCLETRRRSAAERVLQQPLSLLLLLIISIKPRPVFVLRLSTEKALKYLLSLCCGQSCESFHE